MSTALKPKVNFFSKIASYFTNNKEINAYTLHPDEQEFFVGFSLKNEPIYRDSKAWAGHQEWLKHNKSNIAKEQGFLVLHRTAKEAVLLELPSQAQNKYFEKRNAQLIAAQQKDPARQRQKELCRQLFANLPAYVEDDDNLKYFDDEPKKRAKSKRKVALENTSIIPEWEKQQIENAKKQKEERYRSMGFNPDEETVEQGAEINAANQSGAGWPADENGNLTAVSNAPIDEGGNPGKPKTTYTWDEENRLTGSTINGDTAQFASGSGRQRVYKKSSSNETVCSDTMWSAWCSSNPVLEYKNICLGDECLMSKLGTGAHNNGDNSYQKISSYYYHTNHLGRINVISDYKGAEFEYRRYTPYDEEWITVETNLAHSANMGFEPGFTDHIQDKETGLVYANTRYYNPKISCFMSSNLAIDGLNWYNYARNNTVKYNDPTGMFAQKDGTGTIDDDTMSEIARDNNTTVEAIIAFNPQITNTNEITTGEPLNRPGQSSESEDNSESASDLKSSNNKNSSTSKGLYFKQQSQSASPANGGIVPNSSVEMLYSYTSKQTIENIPILKSNITTRNAGAGFLNAKIGFQLGTRDSRTGSCTLISLLTADVCTHSWVTAPSWA